MSSAPPTSDPAPGPRLSARVAGIAESATLAVTATAKRLRAEGRDVVGFGAGEPDADPPAHVVEAAQRASAEGWAHKYTPAGGLPSLREALVDKTRRDTGYEVAPGQVVVTNGGKQAVYMTFQALLDDGDEVLLPAPYWTTYPEAVRLAGGVPVDVPTSVDDGYHLRPEQLEPLLTARTKVLLLCSPSNPTGAVLTPDELEAVVRWADGHGLWVVSDEIYEHLVYGDAEMASAPMRVPEVAERCVVLNGVAKTYAMTGWRIGWLVAPPDVASAVVNLQSHLSSNACNVAQAAALAAVAGPLDEVRAMAETFVRRRDVLVDALDAVAGVRCPRPEGAFYAFPSVSGLLGRPLRGRAPETSVELASLALEEAGVAVVPGEAFGAPGCLRLSYALADDDLRRGVDRLTSLLAEAGGED